MANFSAYGTVQSISQVGTASEVVILEPKAKAPIKVKCFGTPPMVGDEVICVGYISGNEGRDGKLYNNVTAQYFGLVQHSSKPAEYRAPARAQSVETSPFAEENPY